MAPQWSRNAGPSHNAPQPDYKVYPQSKEQPITQENSDHVLWQAIRYLTTEGGSDPLSTYVNQVQNIDDRIIKEYPREGYSYDPQLYRQLRSLVHEVQGDFQRVAQEESSVDWEDSDASIEELFSPGALYREVDEEEEEDEAYEEGEEDDQEHVTSRRVARSATPSPRLAGPRQAKVLQTQYLYGGPNNEVEEWHKDFPAVLPFGETLYMQEWESMKINYDLAESAKKSVNDKNPIVTTDVPYRAVEARFSTPTQYDSGSRFTIPEKVWQLWGQVTNVATKTLSLAGIVDEFNQGGDVQEQEEKDYAPRVFLQRVSLGPKQYTKSAKARGKQPVSHSYLHSTAANARPSASSHDNIGSAVYDQDFVPSEATRRPSVTKPIPKAKSPKSALRKLDERRTALTGIATSAPTRRTVVKKKSKPQEPIARPLQYVQAGPSTKRKRGRPRKDSAIAATPTPSTSATRSRGRKRKLSDPEYTPSPSPTTSGTSAKKAKTTTTEATKAPVNRKPMSKKPLTKKPLSEKPVRKTPAVKTPVVKKSVAFAEKRAPLITLSRPKKAAGVKEGAIKRKGKEMGSVPEVLTPWNRSRVVGWMKRGTTRSGAKFK